MDYHVTVRTLAEFTAKRGDLDLRFTPSPTSLEGIQGHQLVRHRRKASYQAEVQLEGYYPGLRVTGRADGYDPERHRIEEIKTHRGDVERIPANQQALHWAQAKFYAWLLCRQEKLKQVEVCVIYFNVLTKEETGEPILMTARELQSFFNRHCEAFLAWSEQETAHRLIRNETLSTLPFPYKRYRDGQRDLLEKVYYAARDGVCLLAQATTGIGKTLGTIFPQLRALAQFDHDRLFFLTAKTPGRQLALDALHTLQQSHEPLRIRVLEIVSLERACLHKDKACHGESCPLAVGFFDKLPAARQAAVDQRWLSHEAIQRIAATHDLCPYFLAQEMAKWSDVVVCDYNYYFDMSALLYALTIINEWRILVLVDEAHNLIDRARSMYTVSLNFNALQLAQQVSPDKLRAKFDDVAIQWIRHFRDQAESYQLYSAIPEDLLISLNRLNTAITDYLSAKPANQPADLMRFYFDVMTFLRLSESFNDHSVIDCVIPDDQGLAFESELTIRNLLPGPFLNPRLKRTMSTTLFSATLSPFHYYRDLLGLPENTRWENVRSPFKANQLQVRITPHISTRQKDRHRSLDDVCELMRYQYEQHPGNYMAFFSSYEYLTQVLERFQALAPNVPVNVQSRTMSQTDRQQFIDNFTESSQQIGFCVLGGAFGEGIDLPGQRLIGVFITTLGQPAPSVLNKTLENRIDSIYGKGYEYTYLYPGLQKVIQAAGRVIRTETDTGFIWLMDDRYNQPRVMVTLPEWWGMSGTNALSF